MVKNMDPRKKGSKIELETISSWIYNVQAVSFAALTMNSLYGQEGKFTIDT